MSISYIDIKTTIKTVWNFLGLLVHQGTYINESPSRRTDVTHLSYGIVPKDDAKAGKWIIICGQLGSGDSLGRTELDETWKSIKMEIFFQRLLGATCSTSAKGLDSSWRGQRRMFGVIKCYTSDLYDVAEVRQSAKLLRGVINDMNKTLYYVTNVETKQGEADGSKAYANIAMYVYESINEFSARDECGNFKKISPQEEDLENVIPKRLAKFNKIVPFGSTCSCSSISTVKIILCAFSILSLLYYIL